MPPCAAPARSWLPTPHSAANSSPMKRARKHVAQQQQQQQLSVHLHLAVSSRRSRLTGARDLIPHQRIFEWFQRFHRVCSQWRKERAANARVERLVGNDSRHSNILDGIHNLVRSAKQQIRARWKMVTIDASAAGGAAHTDPLALFAPRRNALFKMSETAMEMALAPVFYCCIAMDRVAQRPAALPTTSVFSTSVIPFVLKVFTAASALRQKHLPGSE